MTKGLLSHRLHMEAIDFQLNDSFGPDMEKIIATFEEKVKKGYIGLEIQKLPQVAELEKVIFDRLKMRVKFNTQDALAAIIPFHLNHNAVLLKKLWRNEDFLMEQAEKRESGFASGTVDENNVKLGGVFSDYVHTVYMDFGTLFKMGMKAKEITAILLHELGHGFYACAYS